MNYLLFSPNKQMSILLYIGFLVCLSSKVFAEEPSHFWVNINPNERTSVFNYAPSPSHKGIIYAFSGRNSLLISEDSGITWRKVNKNGDVFFIPRNHIYDVTDTLRVERTDPQTLFSRNNSELEKSSDGGKHWKKVSKNVSIDPESFFLLNPQPMTTLLKGLVYTDNNREGEKRLAFSTDKGEHWTIADHTIQKIDNKEVIIEGINPLNTEILYAKTPNINNNSDLYKSLDGGKSWNNIQPLGISNYIGGLKIHPINPNILYAQFHSIDEVTIFGAPIFDSSNGFKRSKDGGVSWTSIGAINFNQLIRSITLDSTDTRIIYAHLIGNISQNGVFYTSAIKSLDAGKNWELTFPEEQLMLYSFILQSIVVNPLDNQNLFYSSRLSPRVSFNGGKNWQNSVSLTREVRLTRSRRMAIADDDQNIMYIFYDTNAGANHEILKSTDAGFHWRKVNTSLNCIELVINPKNNSNLLCRVLLRSLGVYKENIYHSYNSGVSWKLVKSYEPEQTGQFYLSEDNKLHYSHDGETIYYLHEHLIEKSVDNGDNWDDIITPFSLFPFTSGSRDYVSSSILLDPINANIIYAISSEGKSVYKSFSEGRFWTKQLEIESSFNPLSTRLLIHPMRPNRLLYVTKTDIMQGKDPEIKAFITDNGGNNWTELSSSFTDFLKPDFDIYNLVFDPVNPFGIIASIHPDKLYETTDLGKTWNIVADEFKPSLFSVAGNVYSGFSGERLTLFKSLDTQNCLFSWAEQNYPTLFGRDLGETQFIENYVYRYYKDTNTYLGVFENTNMHLLQADITDKIRDVGFFDYFQSLSGCK